MAADGHQTALTVEQTEAALAEARDLKAWWGRVEAGTAAVERFELFSAFPGGKPTWGFFGEAPVCGQTVPVMGDVGDYFFDRLRVPESSQRECAEWMTRQVEEFALRYWLRTQAWALPQPYPELDQLHPPPFLKSFSLAPLPDPELSGMANAQRYYKSRGSGRIGQFSASESKVIIDLRDLETTYEWITIDRSLLSFDLAFTIGGDNSLSVAVPMRTVMHLVLSADLTLNQRNPEPGTLGVFGIGVGLMKDPNAGPVALGPDKVQPGLELHSLRVLDSGEVRLRTVTIMARPHKLLDLSLDPIEWSLDAAERLTMGAAVQYTKPLRRVLGRIPAMGFRFDPVFGPARLLTRLLGKGVSGELGVAGEQFEKYILSKHAIELRQGLLGTRQTWLQVPDWLDSSSVPEWAKRGEIV